MAAAAGIAAAVMFGAHEPKIDTSLFDTSSLDTASGVNVFAEGLKPSPTPVPEADGTVAAGSLPTATPTPSPYPDGYVPKEGKDYYTFEGVRINRRDRFIDSVDASYNWCDTGEFWEELSARLTGKASPSTVLWFDSDNIRFSHEGVDSYVLRLYRDDINYKISIRSSLEGSALSEKTAEVLKAMLCVFSSTPDELYEAIYESFQTGENKKINTETYTKVGDAKIRVKTEDGGVRYLIHKK